MTAKELKLDYFQFYDVADQPAGQIIGLQGQFDKAPEKAQVRNLNLFGNPVSKSGEPIFDKNAHLSFYNLYDPTPDPIREVNFENQFGKSKLITGRAYALLTPTWKVEPGSSFPKRLDHFKVYQVLQGEPVNKPVKLADQFGKREARVYHPMFFAVPVKKWADGQTFGINNEKAHLVLYRVDPAGVQKAIKARDQFGARIQNVFRSVLLAAPTLKSKWKELD